jgi:hypothetical protein
MNVRIFQWGKKEVFFQNISFKKLDEMNKLPYETEPHPLDFVLPSSHQPPEIIISIIRIPK